MLLTILLLPLAFTTTSSFLLSHRYSNATTAYNATTPFNAMTASNATTASSATTGDDFILDFALTLEYLQHAFYEGGLANFTEMDFVNAGFEDTFYTNLQQIYFDEQSHVSFLHSTLVAAKI